MATTAPFGDEWDVDKLLFDLSRITKKLLSLTGVAIDDSVLQGPRVVELVLCLLAHGAVNAPRRRIAETLWDFVAQLRVTAPACASAVESVLALDLSDARARLRGWVRLSLVERSLSDNVRALAALRDVARAYEPQAVMRTDERREHLEDCLELLSAVDFAFALKGVPLGGEIVPPPPLSIAELAVAGDGADDGVYLSKREKRKGRRRRRPAANDDATGTSIPGQLDPGAPLAVSLSPPAVGPVDGPAALPSSGGAPTREPLARDVLDDTELFAGEPAESEGESATVVPASVDASAPAPAPPSPIQVGRLARGQGAPISPAKAAALNNASAAASGRAGGSSTARSLVFTPKPRTTAGAVSAVDPWQLVADILSSSPAQSLGAGGPVTFSTLVRDKTPTSTSALAGEPAAPAPPIAVIARTTTVASIHTPASSGIAAALGPELKPRANSDAGAGAGAGTNGPTGAGMARTAGSVDASAAVSTTWGTADAPMSATGESVDAPASASAGLAAGQPSAPDGAAAFRQLEERRGAKKRPTPALYAAIVRPQPDSLQRRGTLSARPTDDEAGLNAMMSSAPSIAGSGRTATAAGAARGASAAASTKTTVAGDVLAASSAHLFTGQTSVERDAAPELSLRVLMFHRACAVASVAPRSDSLAIGAIGVLDAVVGASAFAASSGAGATRTAAAGSSGSAASAASRGAGIERPGTDGDADLATMYPPRLVLFFTERLAPADPGAQGGRCYCCGTVIAAANARLCHYFNRWTCIACGGNAVSAIPARLLTAWDATPRAVCVRARAFLSEIRTEAVFDLTVVGNAGPDFEGLRAPAPPSVTRARALRSQLAHLHAFVRTCRSREALLDKLGDRQYIVEEPSYFALRDLVSLAEDEMFLHELEHWARALAAHVFGCEQCKWRGHICERCGDPRAIYPFQTDTVTVCAVCSACVHTACLRPGAPFACVRCARRKQREAARAAEPRLEDHLD